MKLLAIDTTTDACSAAILHGEQSFSRFQIVPREHNRLLFEMCHELLIESGLTLNQLEGVAFGKGPGSFTGVRIAAVFVQAIAFVHQLPVIAVSDLQILAQEIMNRYEHDEVLTLINARLDELYYGHYRRGPNRLASLEGEEAVVTRAELTQGLKVNSIIGGHGLSAYPELKQSGKATVYDEDIWPSAKTMLPLAADKLLRGESCLSEEALPVYLHHPVTKQRYTR